MPTNIDISRPEGSTAQLLFNIVDENGSAIDVTNWTNFELSTYIEPALEFDRTVTFDDTAGGTFSEDIRVIVGESLVSDGIITPTPIYIYADVLADSEIKEYGVYSNNSWKASVDFTNPLSQLGGAVNSVAWSLEQGSSVTLGANVLQSPVAQIAFTSGSVEGASLIKCEATLDTGVVSEYFLIEVINPITSEGVWEIQ